MTETFLNLKELGISIIQGLAITAGVLVVYQYALEHNGSQDSVRSMVFTTLIFANIFLSLVNRSFVNSVFESFRNKNRLFPIVIGVTLALLLAILYIRPFNRFFQVTALQLKELGMALLIAGASVMWFELYKWVKRIRSKSTTD